jgi:hypothetical protein
MASPSSDATTTVRDKVCAPHNHENSCLMRQDESTVLGISIDERGNGVLIPQITHIEILKTITDYENACENCIVRGRTAEGVLTEGLIKRFNIYPLMRINILKNSKISFHSSPICYSPNVLCAEGNMVQIPNGHFVALLNEIGTWRRIAVIINGIKYFGWINVDQAYIFGCILNEAF